MGNTRLNKVLRLFNAAGNLINPATEDKQKGVQLFQSATASLANGAELDSGWLDMEEYPSYGVAIFAAASGLDFIIDSSESDGGGGVNDLQTTTSLLGSFLAVIPPRERYMRFRVSNTSGGAITNVKFDLTGNRCGTGASVFPDYVPPAEFSPALLTQALIRGKDFNGVYQNCLVSDDGELIVTSTEKEFDTRIVIETTGISSTSYCIGVDLSDTTNFLHDNSTGRIDITDLKVVVERGSTSVGYIKIGVITRIDGTDADIEYAFVVPFTKSDVRRVLSLNKFSPSQMKFGYSGGSPTKFLTNVSETTASVNTGVTLDSVRGASTVTPAVGDIILKHEHTSGNAWDSVVEFFYHSDESST